MKNNAGNRRSRNRGGGKRQGGGGGRNNFESNGPEVKVRGTAQQVLEKYLVLARDSASAGDRIKSESCFQFAEHYYRIANADGTNNNNNQNRRDQHQQPQLQERTAQSVEGIGPQPIIEQQDEAEASESNVVPQDEAKVISALPKSVLPAEGEEPVANEGKIDKSVLPAPAPSPRRRVKPGKEVLVGPAPKPAVDPDVA
ncbi:MAG: DUF4167 domain-containing protein [Pseudomonadota bacterium]|nr:DUF4167 domain-containing protein [Pseudomonadota bacterium]